MRLHQLAVEAFGPFVERQVVDVDTLAATGLFLVHGPTGAGKTSVLDAVCYALFANVPGPRQARGLRSDLAAVDRPTSVRLDFTAAGRRLRVTRAPEQLRAKKRGHGLIKSPAWVRLEEYGGSAWRLQSTRNDEAAEIIDDVLGMGLEQFARVALLPQGDFAAFLRASVEVRRALLERLFDVATYTGAESWLNEERRRLSGAVAADERELEFSLRHLGDVLAGLPSRLADGATTPSTGATPFAAPDRWPAAAPEDLAEALREVQAQVQEWATAALTDFDTATTAEQSAAAAHLHARAVHVAALRGRVAERALAELAADDDRIEEVRAVMAAAAAAATLSGELTVLRTAEESLSAGVARVARAEGRLLEGGYDRGRLVGDAAGDRLSRATEVLAAADGQAREAVALAGRSAETRARRTAVELEIERAGANLAATQAEQAAATAIREEQRSVAAQEPHARSVHDAAAGRLRIRREIADLDTAMVGLADAVREARDRALEARAALLDLRQARLDDLAGELASTLTEGCPCPVCGSESHPAPSGQRTPWTPEGLAAAERLYAECQDTVGAVQQEHAEVLTRRATLAGELTSVSAQGGDDEPGLPSIGSLESTLVAAVAGLDRCRSARAACGAAEQRLDAVTARAAALTERRTALLAEAARLGALVEDLEGRLTDARSARIARMTEHAAICACGDPQARGDLRAFGGVSASEGVSASGRGRSSGDLPTSGSPGREADPLDPQNDADLAAVAVLEDVVARHGRLGRVVATWREATRDLEGARDRAEAARAAFAARLAGSGFPDRAAVEAALLPPDRIDELDGQLRSHDESLAVHRATLADAAVADALTLPHPPDPDDSARTQAAARTRMLNAKSDLTLVSRISDEVVRSGTEIIALAQRLAPSRRRLEEVGAMADLVTGGGDNSLRMRLSSFVLAARLERVVALANERLVVMGEGRYRLQHDDARAARGARSGLGLLVLDEWTGATRDPATLSGGESFMASLALALGLADAVRESAGGLELQTLFVDEGFGSLDEESLEHVLGVLDTLRDGGRAVGVVSHVADLRSRITHRLEVVKSPSGSTLRASAAASSCVA